MSVEFLVFLCVLNICLLLVLFWFCPIILLIQAWKIGIKITALDLVAMRLRSVAPGKIVLPAIRLVSSGFELSENERKNLIHTLEAHYLSGGRNDLVVDMLIEARKSSRSLSFDQARSADLESLVK